KICIPHVEDMSFRGLKFVKFVYGQDVKQFLKHGCLHPELLNLLVVHNFDKFKELSTPWNSHILNRGYADFLWKRPIWWILFYITS
ncbi:MAG: hypothetical protein AAF471_07175, partial [Myxococcota bacterium]